MFNDLVESSVAKNATRRPWTITVSVIAQIFLAGILILIPLLYTQALPKAMLNMMLMAPAPPAAAPPLAAQQTRTPQTRTQSQDNIFTAPPSVPINVSMIPETAPPPEIGVNVSTGVPGSTQSGPSSGVIDSIVGEAATAAPTAPAAPPPPILRRGGNVQAALIISQRMPQYPPLARQARIQGDVVLHAIISKDGRVEELSVISGHPLLIQAALDAVRQWRYQPTLLNNEPVEVDTTITVTFTMAGN